jgi:chloride channel 2
MFLNCSWSAPNGSALYCKNQTFLGNWTGESGSFSIFLTLSCFIAFYVSRFCVTCLPDIFKFFMVALALTLPIPSGAFGPSFTLGAAFGRLCGELMYLIFPNGVQIEREESLIYPGVYAVVGAAAFTGGLTHTISVSVIVFELTG